MAEVTDTQGAVLRRNGVAIPGLTEIGPLGIARGLRQVTTLSDTLHKHKLGLIDMPEIACKLYYDAQEPLHAVIFQDHNTRALGNWQIDTEQGNSPAENITFTAYVLNPQIESIGVDADLMLSFSLKPQSVPVGLFD